MDQRNGPNLKIYVPTMMWEIDCSFKPALPPPHVWRPAGNPIEPRSCHQSECLLSSRSARAANPRHPMAPGMYQTLMRGPESYVATTKRCDSVPIDQGSNGLKPRSRYPPAAATYLRSAFLDRAHHEAPLGQNSKPASGLQGVVCWKLHLPSAQQERPCPRRQAPIESDGADTSGSSGTNADPLSRPNSS